MVKIAYRIAITLISPGKLGEFPVLFLPSLNSKIQSIRMRREFLALLYYPMLTAAQLSKLLYKSQFHCALASSLGFFAQLLRLRLVCFNPLLRKACVVAICLLRTFLVYLTENNKYHSAHWSAFSDSELIQEPHCRTCITSRGVLPLSELVLAKVRFQK